MNVKLLKQIRKAILNQPRQFDMRGWFVTSANTPNCGTAACIAGWAIALSNNMNPLAAEDYAYNTSQTIPILARKLLQMPLGRSDIIFHSYLWPEPFCADFHKARSHKARASVAAKFLTHLIKQYERRTSKKS